MSTSSPHTSEAATAVLVFAKSAAADLCARFGGLDARTRLHVGIGLQRQIRREVLASGLPAIFSTEREQRGRTYGERLRNACTDALAMGYERLIVVGGDCPGLRACHLTKAASALAENRAVVGRDLRGGVYLFGFDASRTSANLLSDLPYRRPVLAKALTRLLSTGAEVLELDAQSDVHDTDDLLREQRRFRSARLREIVAALSKAFAKTDLPQAPVVLLGACVPVGLALRGPPALV